MSSFKSSWPVFLGFIAIGVIFGVVLTSGFNFDNKSYADENDKETIYTESNAEPGNTQETLTVGNYNPNAFFVDVVKKVKPSIVTIYTKKNVKIPGGDGKMHTAQILLSMSEAADEVSYTAFISLS